MISSEDGSTYLSNKNDSILCVFNTYPSILIRWIREGLEVQLKCYPVLWTIIYYSFLFYIQLYLFIHDFLIIWPHFLYNCPAFQEHNHS